LIHISQYDPYFKWSWNKCFTFNFFQNLRKLVDQHDVLLRAETCIWRICCVVNI